MKKYVVTDPCYILPRDLWSKCCEELNDQEDQYTRFDKKCTELLNQFAGTTDAYACDTGYGDWTNELIGCPGGNIKQPRFFADAGMVCVCEYTEAVKNSLSPHLLEDGAAVFEIEDGATVHVSQGGSSDWTVLTIWGKGFECQTLPSPDYGYDEEEDEDEED